MPTIKEIAKACNVSVATVSNIINHKGSVGDATRERVEKVIREMNYTPNYVAKNLKTKNTRSIGVIAEDMTVFALPDIIDGITEYCEEADYQILLVNLRLYKKFQDNYYRDNRHKEIVRQEFQKLLAKQVEGIIYVAAHERLINIIPEVMRKFRTFLKILMVNLLLKKATMRQMVNAMLPHICGSERHKRCV